MSDRFAYVVNEIGRLLRWRFEHFARDIGVARPLWRVLLMLSEREGTNQAGLADALMIEHITLTRQLDQLAADGLVERRTDPSDRRVRRLYLTPAAQPLLDRMRAILTQLEHNALDGLADESRAMLVALLDQVHAHLAEAPPDAVASPESRFATFLG